jgi:hypothetical protein
MKLTDIKGIGAKAAETLLSNGIASVHEFAYADVANLKSILPKVDIDAALNYATNLVHEEKRAKAATEAAKPKILWVADRAISHKENTYKCTGINVAEGYIVAEEVRGDHYEPLDMENERDAAIAKELYTNFSWNIN